MAANGKWFQKVSELGSYQSNEWKWKMWSPARLVLSFKENNCKEIHFAEPYDDWVSLQPVWSDYAGEKSFEKHEVISGIAGTDGCFGSRLK